MAQKILGLDINDELYTAVVVDQGAGKRQVLARAAVIPAEQEQPADSLLLLLEEVGWQGGMCICGLPLSCLSLRNLVLPFRDRRKISQVLPFELEDQLIVPLEEQVVEYLLTGESGAGSNLLAFCLEKETLGRQLAVFTACGMEPERITPSMLVLAEQVLRTGPGTQDLLLLHAELHSVSMLVCHGGVPVFLRRLSYPEQMFTRPPFSLQGLDVQITDRNQALDCVRSVYAEVQRSLDFFHQESGLDVKSEDVFLSGMLITTPGFPELIQKGLGRTVSVLNLRKTAGIGSVPGRGAGSQDGLYDLALALALSGLERKTTINFRKGEFAPAGGTFTRRRRILAAAFVLLLLAAGSLGWLWIDYRGLDARYTRLGEQMRSLYRQTFPGATRIVDPLVQMQAGIRQLQAPKVSLPLFTGRKRILEILADISSRIPESVTIHVSRLVIDRESVQVKGTTDTYNNVDTIKSRLGSSPLYRQVKIVSATASKNKGVIRFEIRLLLGEAS